MYFGLEKERLAQCCCIYLPGGVGLLCGPLARVPSQGISRGHTHTRIEQNRTDEEARAEAQSAIDQVADEQVGIEQAQHRMLHLEVQGYDLGREFIADGHLGPVANL